MKIKDLNYSTNICLNGKALIVNGAELYVWAQTDYNMFSFINLFFDPRYEHNRNKEAVEAWSEASVEFLLNEFKSNDIEILPLAEAVAKMAQTLNYGRNPVDSIQTA